MLLKKYNKIVEKLSKRKHLSRKLRKKYHLFDYKELGFNVKFKMDPVESYYAKDDKKFWDFWDAYTDARWTRNLAVGGGCDDHIVQKGGFEDQEFPPAGKRSVSEEDREFVMEFLKGRKDILSFEVSPLIDLWNGYEDGS